MLNQNIKDLRMKKNLSQADFALELGVSQAQVSHWERGIVPGLTYLIQMADYFDVSLDELVGRQG